MEHDAILEMLTAWPTPDKLRKAGRAKIDAKLEKHGARWYTTWTEEILTALTKQTVTVTGTDAAGIVLPHLARQLIHVHAQRADVAREVEEIVVSHPLHWFPHRPHRPGYCDRKHGRGRRLDQAIIALAHRRLAVVYAMLRDGSLYDPPQNSP